MNALIIYLSLGVGAGQSISTLHKTSMAEVHSELAEIQARHEAQLDKLLKDK